MKNTLLVLLLMVVMGSCKKDEFDSIPKIEFKDINPNFVPIGATNTDNTEKPKLIFSVTDAEGDFGNQTAVDSSFIVLKNLQTGIVDSIRFPNLQRAPKKDFKAEVSVDLFQFIDCFSSAPPSPRLDSNYFEVYVRDAKNHKSNTITTTKPAIRQCL